MTGTRGGWKGIVLGCVLGAAITLTVRNFVIEPRNRQAADDAALAVIRGQEAAWNRGDLPGFLADYLMSEDLTFYSDDVATQGWVKVNERYTTRYGGGKMGRLDFTDLLVDVYSSDTVMIRGRWTTSQTDEPGTGLFTILLRKTSGGWKIVHDHTSARQKN